MKKLTTMVLTLGLSLTGAIFSQNAQPASDQPKAAEAGTNVAQAKDEANADKPGIVKIISTRKAQNVIVTQPEMTTTISIPDKVLTKEAMLTWLALGIRTSMDYHFTPKDGGLSCLWLNGEVYNTVWGVELGAGYMWAPISTYSDFFGNSYTGSGSRRYVGIDLIGKYYFWFARWSWVGIGADYAMFTNGYLNYVNNTAAAGSANPATALTTIANTVPIINAPSIFYFQAGIGIKLALTNGFNAVHFAPDLRMMIPINADSAAGVIMRWNLGFTYSFGL